MLAAAFVLFVAAWIVVPAPNIVLLAVAVVASEESPFLIAFAIAVAVAAIATSRGSSRIAALGMSLCAVALASAPLFSIAGTIRESDAQIESVTHRAAQPGETGSDSPFSIARVFFAPRAAEVREQRGLPVPLRDGTSLALDVFHPTRSGRRPAVIVLYGGAWEFGSRSNVAPLARELARRGYTAIAPSYRLAPAHRFPEQIDDVRDALTAIGKHADAWGVDPDRVAVLGESAGAQLALLAAYEPGPLHVRDAIGIYAPLDLVAGYRAPPRPDPADVRAILRNYIGGTPETLPGAYAAAAPRTHVRAELPATLLIGGRRDELVEIAFQRRMAQALRAHGDAVASLEFPWSNHGFAALPGGIGGQLATWYVERFLAETIGNNAGSLRK